MVLMTLWYFSREEFGESEKKKDSNLCFILAWNISVFVFFTPGSRVDSVWRLHWPCLGHFIQTLVRSPRKSGLFGEVWTRKQTDMDKNEKV